jgi:isoamylase
MRDAWYQREGSPASLGCVWLEHGNAFDFALYSRDASAVTLLLFSPSDLTHSCLELSLSHLINKSGRVWHCRVHAEQLGGARYYAYRVSGANAPGSGHRFDDQKVLSDPYAQAIHFPGEFSRAAACTPGSNAGRAP